MINKAFFVEKSEQLNIPFQSLLNAYVLESTVANLAKSPVAGSLWLMDDQLIGRENYKKHKQHIHYAYCINKKVRVQDGFVSGANLDFSWMENMAFYLNEAGQKENITYEIISLDEEALEMSFGVHIDEMYVPLKIHFVTVKELNPEEKNISYTIDDKKTFSYLRFPKETLLVEHILQILKNMELLNDMSHYLAVYNTLIAESIEGKRFQDLLVEGCRRENITINEQRFSQIKSYKDYTYMKKKWKVLLRQQKISEPDWESVINLLTKYLEPIWTLTVNEEIFFGDWMPELKRFLD